jgi:hypothetical protein
MSDKTYDQLVVEFISKVDAELAELRELIMLQRSQTIAAFKEMGFDFNKVKIWQPKTQWPFSTNLGDPTAIDETLTSVAQATAAQAITYELPDEPGLDAALSSVEGAFGPFVPKETTFIPNAGAAIDGDPREPKPGQTSKLPVKGSNKAQGVSSIVSAGGSSAAELEKEGNE